MTTISQHFEDKRYVYLSQVLSQENCQKLTKYMFDLKEKGLLKKDTQCPLSWSLYGDPVFDKILENLKEPLSKQLGISLLPAYTYARIYETGEVLKRHIDRPSCEISGTLTLGFDPESELWPIYFSADPDDEIGLNVNIEVGDLVMYRGNELTHWRPKYLGKWQAQVFFHYVDANGPHKEWAYDKRDKLNIEKITVPQNTHKEEPKLMQEVQNQTKTVRAEDHIVYGGVMLPDFDMECPGLTSFSSKFKPELAFTKNECLQIIDIANRLYPEKSKVGSSDNGKYDPSIRRVEQYKIELNNNSKWIFDRITKAIAIANHEYFKYDLMGITHELQLLHYKSDDSGFYDWHTDNGPGHASKRKISVSVMLSDENDYEGGNLLVNNYGTVISCTKEQGSINMFPSFLLHTVTPVQKGDRWVLVIWIHGSQRFR